MGSPSMESFLTGRSPHEATPPPPPRKGIVPDGLKTVLIVAALAGVGYLLYDGNKFQQKTAADIAAISEQLKLLDSRDKAGDARLTSLKGELSQTQASVGTTKQELLRKTAAQIEAETHRTKAELNQALSTKADSSQVQALKQESDTKIAGVSTEVGGVKTDVGNVKTDLATTKRDLEGTQRSLVDVKETLTAAVAKNASELSELRRKGERDFFEFEINKKNVVTKVEDIRLVLTNTDPKKGKYSLQVMVDDNRLEKRERTINEPVQFLVGRNRLRYEVVINWVQKDKVGGYLSIPKDKALGAERTATK
jgi:hypothetical protein